MDRFVARQPIFDRHLNVFAYELLFRSGFHNFCDAVDGDEASSDVLTTSFIIVGLDELTSGKKASINFTRNLLVGEVATLFPQDQLLVEVLESVRPDGEVIAACRNLKRRGYCIMLDDFAGGQIDNPLLEVVDIVKVDFARTDLGERESIAGRMSPKGINLLAEKIEKREEFNQALEWGYSYFQGYFFCKPVIHRSHAVPASKAAYLRIINEINKPDLDFGDVENIIKQDVSLSYNLLRFINSAYFALCERIHSIRHALTLLGIREIRKWIALTAFSRLGEGKPEELIVNSLVRARLCEELAERVGLGGHTSELFLMGLFSLIDAIMDSPMSEVLRRLPLSEEIKIALTGGENRLRDVYDAIVAYEKGDWGRLPECAARLDLDENDLPPLYHNAVKWVNQILQLSAAVSA